MHTTTAIPAASPDIPRITAIATSLAAHAAAALIIALPLTMPAPRQRPPVVAAVLISEPPPPPAIPDEPVPQQRAAPHSTPTPIHRPPPIAPVETPTTSAPLAAATPEPVASPPADLPRTPAAGIGDAQGATRLLSYDGALKLRYPVAAIRARAQGEVLLSVLVDAQGKAQRIEIAHSSGHASLDAAARAAVAAARFKPVLRDGVAIPAWGLVPIRFRLDEA